MINNILSKTRHVYIKETARKRTACELFTKTYKMLDGTKYIVLI